MNDSSKPVPWNNLYEEIASKYNSQERASWYSDVAYAYHRTRPRYPQTVCDRVNQLTNLTSDSTVLELGCGPGTATISFAKLGWWLIGLEPSYQACQLARKNCLQYPQVKIINTTFEAWKLKEQKFDAVLAANSFHWLDPQTKYQKTAAALKDNGCLILLWNTPPQIEFSLYQSLKQVYQTHAPSIQYQGISTHQDNLNQIAATVINSGYYRNLQTEQLIGKVTYSLNDYLTLLGTLSPYIMLELETRESLFAEIRKILRRNCGGYLTLSHLLTWQIARKI